MWTLPDLKALNETAVTWFLDHVWTLSAFVQGAFIFSAFMLGALVAKVTESRLTAFVNTLKAPVRIKQILHNLRRLVMPLATLVFLLCFRLLEVVVAIPGSGDLLDAAMSLIFAWIIIRMAVQFIGNNFIRNVFALSIWAIAALSIVGILDDVTSTLDQLGMNIGNFRFSALTVIKGVFAVCALLYIATFVSSLAERRIQSISGLTVSSKVLISKVLRVALIVFALLIGITSAGIDLSLLAVFSGAVGLGVGFGLQKGISNLFSGMLLLMDKSITPGDIIELQAGSAQGTFGWVKHMGARYTEIVTRDNKSYLIPNEDFITQQVVNWSHGDTLVRIDVSFGVHYSSDPHQIRALAIEAAKKPERVMDKPEPVCHLAEFGDNSLNFSLRFWIKDAQEGLANIRGDVMLALWDIFKENNVEIPYPQRVVHMATPVTTKPV